MNQYVDPNNSKSLTLILYVLYILAIFTAGILAVCYSPIKMSMR